MVLVPTRRLGSVCGVFAKENLILFILNSSSSGTSETPLEGSHASAVFGFLVDAYPVFFLDRSQRKKASEWRGGPLNLLRCAD